MSLELASRRSALVDCGHGRGCQQRRVAAEHKISIPEFSIPKISIPDLLYGLLAISGWLATTALIVGGVFVALFVAAGNGTMAGFFAQFDLLARHYLAAEPLRRAAFDGQLLIVVGSVFAVTAFLRRTALMAIFLGGTDGPTITN